MVDPITDQNFEQETSKGLVLTDFWASWCGPCRMQAPVIDKLSKEYDDVKFTKMDTEANPNTPNSLGIKAIPTLILKKDGQIVETIVGYHDEDQLKQIIDKHS